MGILNAKFELKESKSDLYLPAILDGLSTHIVVIDEQGEITLTNKAYRDFARQNGIDPDAVSEGVNYLAVCDSVTGPNSEEACSISEGIRDVLSGRVNYFELEYPCHSPEESRWFIARITPFVGEETRRVIIAHENISEHKQAVKNLAQKSKLLEESQALANLGSWEWDMVHDAWSFSEQWKKIHGLSYDDLDTAKLMEIAHPEDAKYIDKAFTDAKERGKTYDIEHRIIRADNGEIRYVKAFGEVEFDHDNGRPVRIVGIVQDISERKQAEDKLIFQNVLLKTQQEVSMEGILIVDDNDKIISFNQRFADIWGIPDSIMSLQSSEKALQYVLPKLNDPDEFYQRIHDLYKNKEEKSHEEITLKDGNILERYSSPMFGSNNEYYGRVWYYRDITERRRLLKELEILNAKLKLEAKQRAIQLAEVEASNKELEAFSYSVSHDLRAPLRHINSYIDLINHRYRDELPEKAKHYLETVTRASSHLGTLIDDLLEYSKIGRRKAKKTELNFNVLIEEVLIELKSVRKGRKIKWDIQELPKVFGDYGFLKRVWSNLLDNAIKYTRNQQVAEISIGYREEANDLVFYVSDNGTGFDMKYAHKLFGVFQRLHAQTEIEGTGIGLANVKRIVHNHSGRVWAESEPGKGAKFYFSLPKYPK